MATPLPEPDTNGCYFFPGTKYAIYQSLYRRNAWLALRGDKKLQNPRSDSIYFDSPEEAAEALFAEPCQTKANMNTKPGKKVSRLTFEIVTTAVWNDEAIHEIADEFQGMYSGNMNIASACLSLAEEIDDPYPDDDDSDLEPEEDE